MTREEIDANCPDGYAVYHGGTIDMLGRKDLWKIYEHHAEPDLMRIPQDFVDTPYGPSAKRIPPEWGKCLYYKVV